MYFMLERHVKLFWSANFYWLGKITGVLVLNFDERDEYKFTVNAVGKWRWFLMRAVNMSCMGVVMYRIYAETWPMTIRAVNMYESSCYDIVCGGVWCTYACVYYTVSWLDRISEISSLVSAIWWRFHSTVKCLNFALARCSEVDNAQNVQHSTIPWYAVLPTFFSIVQFVMSLLHMPSAMGKGHLFLNVFMAITTCSANVSHGLAIMALIIAENSMRSINHDIVKHFHSDNIKSEHFKNKKAVLVGLACRHCETTDLVTGDEVGVCNTFGFDILIAVILAVTRVTYTLIAVLHLLTDDVDVSKNHQENVGTLTYNLAIAGQLVAWFGQFSCLMFACDRLIYQVSKYKYTR